MTTSTLRITIIAAVTLVLTGTATGGNPPAQAAAVMLQRLQASTAPGNFPEEYINFTATITTAEQMLHDGNQNDADQLFLLAILKGEILLEHATVFSLEKAAALPPRFQQLSSAGSTSPPLQTGAIAPIPVQIPATGENETSPILSTRIIGGDGVYVVKKKEQLKVIASRLGVRLRYLARMNQLKTDATVFAGQRLRYNNRRIVPKSLRNGIVVNIPDRNLYLFRNGKISANYPVALGKSRQGDSTIWRTPVGKFRITDKKENPVWRIPVSIQKEMEENGEEVVETVPPGPKNPLGKYAMRTTLAGILIHSTTRPSSINSYSSHGCIRVMPEHMERLFHSVKVPTEGEIIYQPVKVEVTADGKVFLEVNHDSYDMVENLTAEVKSALKKYHASNRVSWLKVSQVINEKSGIAEDVSLSATPD